MRGLGIGMVVTALLMGIATGEKIPLSDAEIRAKALELGMVEGDSLRLTDLQNVQPSSDPAGGQPSGEEALAPERGSGQEDAEDSGTAQEGKEPSESGSSPGGQENPSEPGSDPEEDRPVTIVIEAGMDSYSICKMLAESGLLEDAAAFDEYIYGLGYSRYIQAGTYEISIGTDMEEIAKIITGNRNR